MNNLSGHLNLTSCDSHFGRNKRKKDTGSDKNENVAYDFSGSTLFLAII